jgi:hypothetical protein
MCGSGLFEAEREKKGMSSLLRNQSELLKGGLAAGLDFKPLDLVRAMAVLETTKVAGDQSTGKS